jgi:hypothetical protein
MIEILNLEVVNKGVLIAKFTAKMHKMGGLLIRECSLFESNGKRWINLPSRQYEVEGKKKYYPYVAFENREMEEKFKGKIMEEVIKLLKVKGNEPEKEADLFEVQGDLPF